jgi:hypothetical protein
MVLYDVYSNLPEAGIPGRMFYVASGTNAGNVYRDNGSSWQLVTLTTSGAVTGVTGTAPIASSGGSAPVISIANMTGDSGSGGAAGAVPAPGAGTAAAGKFLKADGTWAVPPGTASGTVTGVTGTAPIASSGGSAPVISIANMTGDSGSGGAAGAVPAPGSGAAAAGKFLKADGTWAVPSTGTVGVLSIDTAPASPSAYDDEFTGTSLNTSLWTSLANTAGAVSYSGQVPGSIFVKFTGNQAYSIYQAFAPAAADCDITLCCAAAPGANYQGVGLYLGDTHTDPPSNGVGLVFQYNSNVLMASVKQTSGGGNVAVGAGWVFTQADAPNRVYLHLQRVSGTWSGWFYTGGGAWSVVQGNYGVNPTINYFIVSMNQNGATAHTCMSIDWVRVNWFVHP